MPTVAEAGRRKLFVLIWLLLFSIDEGRNPLFWVILGNPDLMNQQLMVRRRGRPTLLSGVPAPSWSPRRRGLAIWRRTSLKLHLRNEPYVWEMFCNLA